MRICQSCGMPMSMCPQRGGSNFDGSRSKLYCSYCWQRGRFTDGISDVEEFKTFIYRLLRREKFPPVKAWYYASKIPRLSRWKQS